MPEAKDKSKEQPEQPPAQKFGAEPFEIPVLPLRNTTLFPETMVPLAAGRPASVAAVEAALAGEEKLLACISVRPEKPEDQDTKPADLFQVGTLVMIKRMERVEDTLHLIVQGTDRIRVLDWAQKDPFLRARVQILPELEIKNKEEVEAAKRNVQALIQQASPICRKSRPKYAWLCWARTIRSGSRTFSAQSSILALSMSSRCSKPTRSTS